MPLPPLRILCGLKKDSWEEGTETTEHTETLQSAQRAQLPIAPHPQKVHNGPIFHTVNYIEMQTIASE